MSAAAKLPLRLACISQKSNPRGRGIVLTILKGTFPQPVHTREIFQCVRKEFAHEKLKTVIPRSPPPIVIHRRRQSIRDAKTNNIPQPPFPDHPIRSQKYLREVILEDLARRRLIKKVHIMRDPTPEELAVKNSKAKKKGAKMTKAVTINLLGKVDEWGWTIRTAAEKEAEKLNQARIQKAIEGQDRLNPKKVEKEKKVRFGLEWGHLNVRRQNARVGKLEREDFRASILEKMREEGRREAEENPTKL